MLAPRPLERLIEVLSMLPSVGRKSAQRLAFFLLKQNEKHVSDLAAAILEAKEKIISCEKCFNYTEISPCAVCEDEKRVSGQLCVVEQASIVYAIENTGLFKGRYHVLGGLISPLDGVGPSDIHLFQLKDRIQSEGVNEITMALCTVIWSTYSKSPPTGIP